MSVVLFAGSTPFVSAHGGAHKANRILGEQLAARGHTVYVAALARRAMRKGETLEAFLEGLQQAGVEFSVDGTVVSFMQNGVHVQAIDGGNRVIENVTSLCERLSPDVVIVSSEDWRQRVLTSALDAAPGRVVYQGRTLTSLPFGPYADDPHADRAALVARATALVAPCSYFARYIRDATGRDVEVIYNLFDSAPAGPQPPSPRFVTMINPCGIKGLSIFVALAQAFPDRAFAAVPTWGTSAVDLETLARLPNVSILPAVDDVGVIYAQTRVLVVPSLCPEGLSNVVVEAMLRGIPVLASDLGGLPEATQGAGVLLPVRPIEGFRLQSGLPVARAIAEQDATPWCDALAVLDDQTAYAGACARAQRAAIAFARSTTVEPYERLFATLARTA